MTKHEEGQNAHEALLDVRFGGGAGGHVVEKEVDVLQRAWEHQKINLKTKIMYTQNYN